MKAVVLKTQGGPEVLVEEEVPDPTPGPDQVVLKVLACGVCGHDQADRTGLTKIDLPCILGHEIAGEVVALGTRARGFQVGDVVACKQFTTCGVCFACRSGRELDCARRRFNYGGMAEFVALDDQVLLKVPEGVDPVAASVVACGVGTSYQALAGVGKLVPGEWVAISGAGGGLGVHAVQVAAALGGRVLAVTTSPHKAEFLRGLGAEHVVVAAEGNVADRLLEATGGQGVHLVLDNVGHPDFFSQGFRALRKRGRYVFTGQLYRERVSFYPLFAFSREVVITGSSSTLMSSFMKAMELVQEKRVNPVTETYPLSQASAAHEAMDSRKVVGRAVVIPEA
ncbi:MAG TPA: zinc-binding dehydrogenase [Candidatus Saccharimonadales bacterium]|nr:zinc-binding dehydrogenase [Candidatus Saccharimonadales bacterium]